MSISCFKALFVFNKAFLIQVAVIFKQHSYQRILYIFAYFGSLHSLRFTQERIGKKMLPSLYHERLSPSVELA